MYNVDDIKKVRNINLTGIPKSVREILQECLIGSGLAYEIRDKVIIIKPDPNVNGADSELHKTIKK